MNQPLRESRAALFRKGGVLVAVGLLALFCTRNVAAQTLRLGDVFTTPTQTVSTEWSLATMSASRTGEYLGAVAKNVAAGENEKVLRQTELLTAWLPKDSADYGRALWYRAQAYEGLEQNEKFSAIAVEYLKAFPKGAERGWFLVRLADEKTRQEKHDDAAVIWRGILEAKLEVTAEESLRGAEALLRQTDPRAARQLLMAGERGGVEDSAIVSRRQMLQLESLLELDDRELALPAARPWSAGDAAAYNLRRAVLTEMRGDRAGAARLYAELDGHQAGLTDEERELLRRRMEGLDFAPWPPAGGGG
jgi:hypothetical protein